MTLPRIDAYPMPAEEEIPKNHADWRLDGDRCVLLIHDMQRYFLDAFRADAEPVPTLVDNIRSLRERCVERGVPTIYTTQPGSQEPWERGLLQDFWGRGLSDEPAHTAVIADLAPREEDTVVTKRRYSAFANTGLSATMGRLGRDQLVVCGVYAHIGVLMTACDAFMRDVEPFIVADAVADFSAEDHSMALTYATRRCAMAVSTRNAMTALGR
ncbi:isochorismatase family protein [Nocardiopsis ansamitocini]|uniref:Isochorismatase-like domain-containing protein n=1 Tax=Nocardiopsis ansamitocini TaxID=1670832 RepID=A0A9W6UIS0_9ACTN|nr:isochorismatase family protein [Nocardiopsis ansamitocini]GLU50206.1 hypothetical protein Nans01_45570 [Nocardiopsis ansamitocini]